MSSKKGSSRALVLSIAFFVLSAVWAGVIFGFSAQDSQESASLSGEVTEVIIETFDVKTEPDIIEYFVRKLAHFCEYAVLGGLLFGAFAFLRRHFEKAPYFAAVLSSITSLVYAASDELHQHFVSGRSPQLKDVLIDTSGAVLAGLLICLILYIIAKVKTRRV